MTKLLSLVFVAALAVPGLALAHAHAVKTTPAANASVRTLTEIHVDFSEPVNPAFTGLEIIGADGKALPAGKPVFDAKHLSMRMPVAGLKPATYKVKWHAVSGDTHRSEGAFNFTVEP
jgi:hypothetical protein